MKAICSRNNNVEKYIIIIKKKILIAIKRFYNAVIMENTYNL